MSTDLSPAAAIRAFAFSSAPATPTPPATPPAAPTAPPAPELPTPSPVVEPHGQSSLSPSQAATMAEWVKDDLAKGKISAEEATKRFDSLNATPEQRAPDTRSAEVKLLDQHFPPAKEGDFLIRYGLPGQAVPMTTDLKRFDQSARVWLRGAEFPRDHGNSLITQIERTVQATKGMTPEQLESYGMVEYEKLQRAYGGEEKLQEKLRAAAVMIDALDAKQPGLKNLLKSKGIGDNALVASLLIQQAERYHARRGRSGAAG